MNSHLTVIFFHTHKLKAMNTNKIHKDYPFVLTKNTSHTPIDKIRIKTSLDSADYARNFYHDDIEIYESFFIILLNKAINTIGWAKISQGGISATLVDTALVAKYAIESLAKYVVLVHNHPSGNTSPSSHDNILTKKIKEGLKLFDICLLDHVIITKDSHYSYSDEGAVEIL